ncbi:MAG: hypothetical protein WC782_06735 [Methylococcaceae bacterium]|jgi:hypothetical protein
MSNEQLETCIQQRDKSSLYRYHMDKEINDDQLLEAIIKIDNSIKTKKTDWLAFIHNILFPSVAH